MIFFVLLELPKAPSNLKAYAVWGSSISLGWKPGDSGRALILYFKIDYNNDTDYHLYPNRAKWHMIRNLTRSKILENPANITGLRPSSIYRFRMTAVNRIGPSPISNISDDITTGEGSESILSQINLQKMTLVICFSVILKRFAQINV